MLSDETTPANEQLPIRYRHCDAKVLSLQTNIIIIIIIIIKEIYIAPFRHAPKTLSKQKVKC